MLKYEATVSAVGPLVGEFLASGIVVLFGEGAPAELAEFAVLHHGGRLMGRITKNDTVSFDGMRFRILAVGDIANENLGNLGHLVLKFNGRETPELPGDVCVEAKPLPPIHVGTKLRIEQP